MPDKKTSHSDFDFWTVIAKGFIETITMIFSALAFIFAGASNNKPNIEEDNSENHGYRSYGFHSKSIKPDE